MTDDAPTGPREGLVRRLRGASSAQVQDLELRVAELEEAVRENRRLNRRLAELMDLVEELLVPLAERDEERVRAYLESHASTL